MKRKTSKINNVIKIKMIKAIVIVFIVFASIDNKVNAQIFAPAVKQFIEINDSVVVISNVKIIDGTGGPVQNNRDVLFVKNKIHSIGATGKIAIPKDAKVIDGTGKTLIPGLIMLHEHLFYAKPFEGDYKAVHMTYMFPKMYLAGGVTTMRTAGSIEANADLNVKNLIVQGKMTGPKMDVSTPHIEREGFIPQIQSLYGNESPERMVDYWVDKGVTSVKLYNNITKDDMTRVIKAAHARKIKVTGHLCSITYREAADLGMDNLEHTFTACSDFMKDKKEDQCDNGKLRQSLLSLNENSVELKELMQYLIKKKITLTYTPVVFEPFTNREVIPGGGIDALAPFLKEQIQGIYNSRINKDSLSIQFFKAEMKRVKQFYNMGGKLIVGTDPTGPGRTIAGYANQHLIELLIETSFTLTEAIKLSTLNGAKYLEIEKETGTVEVGKTADLVLIDGDLEKDISNIRKMEIVFKEGVGFSSKKIFDSVKGKVGLD
ncbi:MAG: amidohydrolase family protein [bacterium]|nr:amidohydrolase family protein [bacterium]